MEKVYLALLEYLGDKKILVEYVYVYYKFLSKYGKSFYNFLDKLDTDVKFIELGKFFKEENYSTKDIYVLLEYLIKKTSINVFEVLKSDNISLDGFIKDINGDIIEKLKQDDIGIKIKTADSKIYKRFLLEDVKKILKI